MHRLITRVRTFILSEDGPTTTEYAVMLALIIIVSIVAIAAIGQKVSDTYTTVDTGLPDGS